MKIAPIPFTKECKIIESVVVQPSKRAKEVSPVRERWEKEEEKRQSPVRGGTAMR